MNEKLTSALCFALLLVVLSGPLCGQDGAQKSCNGASTTAIDIPGKELGIALVGFQMRDTTFMSRCSSNDLPFSYYNCNQAVTRQCPFSTPIQPVSFSIERTPRLHLVTRSSCSVLLSRDGFFEDVDLALKQKPNIVFFPETLFDYAQSDSEFVSAQIANCLKTRALPIVVSANPKHLDSFLPGCIHIHVYNDNNASKASPHINSVVCNQVSFGIANSSIGQHGCSKVHSALKYIIDSIACLGQGSHLGHLDIASSFYRGGEFVHVNYGSKSVLLQEFHPETRNKNFEKWSQWRTYSDFDELVGDAKTNRDYSNEYGSIAQERSIKFLVNRKTRWSHLDAFTRLTCTKPRMIQGLDEFSIALVQLNDSIDSQSIDEIVSLFRAHSQARPYRFVYRVSKNVLARSD